MKNQINFYDIWSKQYRTFFAIVLGFFAAYNICMVDLAQYQINKDIHFYKGISLLLALVIIVRTRLADIPVKTLIFSSITYVGAYAYYLYVHNSDWEELYRAFLIYKGIAIGLIGVMFLLLLTELGKYGNYIQLSRFGWFTLITFCLGIIFETQYTLFIIVPISYFYMLQYEDWNLQNMDFIMAIDLVAACLWIETKAYIMYPDNYYMGRWCGIAGIAQNGAVCGIAFVTLLYLIYDNIRQKRKKQWLLLFVPILAWNTFLLKIVSSRSSLSGIFFTIAVLILLVAFRKVKEKAIVIFGVVIAMLLVFCCVMFWYSKQTESDGDNLSRNESRLYLAISVLNGTTVADETDMIFGGNRALAALDILFSSRIQIYRAFLKDSTLLGTNSGTLYTTVSEELIDQPHNSYVDWIYSYGWICGILLNVWFFILLGITLRKTYQNDVSYLYFILMFCAVFFFTDLQTWDRITGFSLLLLQGRYLFHKETPLNKPTK